MQATADDTVVFVEGEKDVERLRAEGFIAACNFDGASKNGAKPKWRADDYNYCLSGTNVCIIPDNDRPGIAHAQFIANSLSGTALSVKVIELPGLEEGEDVSDWLDKGNSTHNLEKLCADTPTWDSRINTKQIDHVVEIKPTHTDYLAPPLLEYAVLSLEQLREGSTAGKLLDEYVAFAAKASPLTPLLFHESIALFLGALAIARRLCLRVSVDWNTIYPNIYLLFVGLSTKPRKTTALRVARGLIEQAGMSHFLLADRQTPEALLQDLSINIPSSFEKRSERSQESWLKERAIASQRGWLLEEASHLLDSFNRDYTSGLLPIVLDLYDSSERGPQKNTISRGLEGVTKPYLSIFGATTYGALANQLRQPVHWNNGLWARFAIVSDDNPREWQFWPPPLDYPSSLVQKLQHIAFKLFPMPVATFEHLQSDGPVENTLGRVVIDPPLQSESAAIEQLAWDQWEKDSSIITNSDGQTWVFVIMSRATGQPLIRSGLLDPLKLRQNSIELIGICHEDLSFCLTTLQSMEVCTKGIFKATQS